MTPTSRVSGEFIPAPNKPTLDKVDTPKASPASAELSTPTPATATASTSNAIAPTPARNPTARIILRHYPVALKVPTSINLTCNGFDLTFSTESAAWVEVPKADAAYTAANEDRRVFKINMSAPVNAALPRYIKDLVHVCAESAGCQRARRTRMSQ
jgi:hypothetical protein